jgi:hypothetical protein
LYLNNAFVQPVWIVGTDILDTFGMISLCLTRTVFPGGSIKQECEFYGGYFNLGNLPSGAWQAACVLYGAGCVLLSCGAFLAVCTSCIPCDVVRTVTVMETVRVKHKLIIPNVSNMSVPTIHTGWTKAYVVNPETRTERNAQIIRTGIALEVCCYVVKLTS